MSAARAVGYALAYLWAFWAAYVLVMGIYRAHLAKRLGPVAFCLSLPFLALGLLMDVLAQFTVAALLFWQWPCPGEWLVTSRMRRYVAQGTGWRYRVAKWVCDNLLDVFDPSGEHC